MELRKSKQELHSLYIVLSVTVWYAYQWLLEICITLWCSDCNIGRDVFQDLVWEITFVIN
jgi:hypothetical protein